MPASLQTLDPRTFHSSQEITAPYCPFSSIPNYFINHSTIQLTNCTWQTNTLELVNSYLPLSLCAWSTCPSSLQVQLPDQNIYSKGSQIILTMSYNISSHTPLEIHITLKISCFHFNHYALFLNWYCDFPNTGILKLPTATCTFLLHHPHSTPVQNTHTTSSSTPDLPAISAQYLGPSLHST